MGMMDILRTLGICLVVGCVFMAVRIVIDVRYIRRAERERIREARRKAALRSIAPPSNVRRFLPWDKM